MSLLRIRLFGTFQVSHDGRAARESPIHAVQALLAYLVLHRKRTHAREVLAGLFWGEHSEARARSCLSTALWRLRQVLEPTGVDRGTYLVTMRSGEIGFNTESHHWVDVAAFEDGLHELLRMSPERSGPADWQVAESAVAHYTGDLLEGFYEEWALRERERLRMGYLTAMGRLLEHYSATGAIDLALDCGWRILELDPLREEVHREIMRLHLRTGHRALAAQQFETCRELLARELEVEPMEETRRLYRDIARDVAADFEPRPRPVAPPAVRQPILPRLRAAAMSLEAARDQLGRAIRLAETDETNPPR